MVAEFQRGAGDRVRTQLENVERALKCERREGVRARLRDVVVIASSSRGGSSMLAELLRRTPQLLHFRAEVNPFFVLSGLSYPSSDTDSDMLGERHASSNAVDMLDRYFASDIGWSASDDESLRRFPLDLACRVAMQWPDISFDPHEITAMARDVQRIVDPRTDLQRFHVHFLHRLRQRHAAVNTWFYDLVPQLVEEAGAVPSLPQGPPGEVVVEEPPFVAIGPWKLAETDDLANRPLIVKTPSNAYRLDFLRALFPQARFRVLHLCRNAAAAINGLVDGWNYRGFFAHAVDRPLSIEGYTDKQGPWAKKWWKFDLPPGWVDLAERPLIEVCAYQWRAAHEATLKFIDSCPQTDVLRVQFEDIVGTFERRDAALRRIVEWLGITLDAPLTAAIRSGMPPVMATATPRQRRWFQKAVLLEPMLARPEIREMMERLGYDCNPTTWE